MQKIYILGTAMPIPNKYNVKDSYKDVTSRPFADLNTSYLNTFERELGLAMVNNNDLTLQIETVENVYKKTANIMDSTIEPKILLTNNDTHSGYDNR